MTKKEDNIELNQVNGEGARSNETDAAGKSLSEALEISFAILKVIMLILIVAFFVSGFKTVAPGEEALVLRFGKIRGTGEKRILKNGAHWILPYPIDEIVKIPIAPRNLDIDSFWYYLTDREILAGKPDEIDPNKALNPISDGYCLTRSEAQDQGNVDSEGNDYNIVHTKWQLTYNIENPELFFTNVQIPNLKPSDIYDDVIQRGIEPLLQGMFEDVVVTKMVNYTIDEAITSRDRIPADVKKSLQDKLDSIDSGIRVISVQLTKSEVPRQVKKAFEATTKASQNRSEARKQAETNATRLLNETAGPIARQLYEALHDDTISEEAKELLWSKASGNIRGELEQAQTYATTIASNAEASAKYLQSLLPEYRKRPDVVINRLYYDMLEKIYANAEEKFTIQSSKGAGLSETWVEFNRDTSLKPKEKEEQEQQQ